MHIKLIIVYILPSLILISGCTSTEQKTSNSDKAPTNQKIELIEKTPIATAPEKVTPLKTIPKQQVKVEKTVKVASKPIVKKAPKEREVKVNNNIEKSSDVVKTVSVPKITLDSLTQLPLTLNHGWMVEVKKLPLTSVETCVLYQEKNGVFDGYKDNDIKLYLTRSQLLVISGSNFDLSYPDTGVYVDNNDNDSSFYPLSLSSQHTIAVLTLPLNEYIKNSSKALVVKSGFWPSWPITETKTLQFTFPKVDSMIKILNTCTSLLTAQ